MSFLYVRSIGLIFVMTYVVAIISVLWATIEDALSGLRALALANVLEIDFEMMTRI